MGPIELLYCWQALLIAIVATGITQLIKTIVDVAWGATHPIPTPAMADAKKLGEELRKKNLIMNRFVMPMAPILVGAVAALLVPIYPDELHTYIDTHAISGTSRAMVLALWGGACGQFADYGFSKVKAALGDFRARRESTPPPAM